MISKTLATSVFGLAGAGAAAGLISSSVVSQNKATLVRKCTYSSELEGIFSEIKELYESFKTKYQALKGKLPKEKIPSKIDDSDLSKIDDASCFQDFWNLLNNLLTPLNSTISTSSDPELKELKEPSEKLKEKIDEFYTKNGSKID